MIQHDSHTESGSKMMHGANTSKGLWCALASRFHLKVSNYTHFQMFVFFISDFSGAASYV